MTIPVRVVPLPPATLPAALARRLMNSRRRQIGGLLTLEDAVDVAGRSPVWIARVWPVGHQPTARHEEPERVHRGQAVLGRQSNDQFAPAVVMASGGTTKPPFLSPASAAQARSISSASRTGAATGLTGNADATVSSKRQ